MARWTHLDDTQKKFILDNKDLFSKNHIANHIGISKNSITWFLRKNGLKKNHSSVSKNMLGLGLLNLSEYQKKAVEANTGAKRTKAQKERMSEARKKIIREGKVTAWGYGMPQPKIHGMLGKKCPWAKKRMSGPLNPNYEGKLWKNNEFIEKNRVSRRISPNKKEQLLMALLLKNSLPYRFVGDFSFWIDGKNPDFTHQDEKKLIELFSEYWHRVVGKNRPNYSNEQNRISFFKERGYDCLVIWEHELKEPEKVIEKIKTFS